MECPFPVNLPMQQATMRCCAHETRERHCRTFLSAADFPPEEGGARLVHAKRITGKRLMRLAVIHGRWMGSVRKGGGRSGYPAPGCPAAVKEVRPVFSSPLAQARGVIRSNRSIRIDLTWPLCGQVADHSHSMVPGGLDVMSYTTRLMPRTSLTMRVAVRARKLCSKG
jgi:hypothetical protein